MNILCVPYGSEHQQAVRVGDTLRILVSAPQDGNTWTGNVNLRVDYNTAPVDDVGLSSYVGARVAGKYWDLFKNYDTTNLAASTKYLVTAQISSAGNTVEYQTTVTMLPQGRT